LRFGVWLKTLKAQPDLSHLVSEGATGLAIGASLLVPGNRLGISSLALLAPLFNSVTLTEADPVTAPTRYWVVLGKYLAALLSF